MVGYIGKPNVKDSVKDWTKKLKAEQRKMQRNYNKIEREEKKITRHLQKAAKDGHVKIAKTYAKSLARSMKTREKLLETKTMMGSICMNLKMNYATMQVAESMQQSASIMRHMSSLMRLPQINKACMGMAKEMAKAGIIQEMVDETFEMVDDEDIEELADEEVDNVLYEVTKGKLGALKKATGKIKKDEVVVEKEDIDEKEKEDVVGDRLKNLMDM